MNTIGHKMIAAVAYARDIVSRLRKHQFEALIQISTGLNAKADLGEVLDELRTASRINDGEFLLEGQLLSGKKIVRVFSNMIAVYIAKTFIFTKDEVRTEIMRERYQYARDLLPKLIAADRRWNLVTENHRAYIVANLPTELQKWSNWGADCIRPPTRRPAIPRRPPSNRMNVRV